MIASLLLVVLSVPQSTWVVDSAGGPGTTHADLPPAIAAAQSGDTILVRAGSYTGFTIYGKSVTIRGSGVGTCQIGATTITATPVGPVQLSGVHVIAADTLPLEVQGVGSVALMDIEVTANTSPPNSHGQAALNVLAAKVWAVRSRFTGADLPSANAQYNFGGAGGYVAAGAVLHAHDCSFFGGAVTGLGNLIGGDGVWTAGSVQLHDCQCTGGVATGVSFSGPYAGDGVEVAGGTCRLFGQNCTLRAGLGIPVPTLWAVHGYALRNSVGLVLKHPGVTLLSAVPGGATSSGAVISVAVALPGLRVSGTVLASGALHAAAPAVVQVTGAPAVAPFLLAIGLEPRVSPFPIPVFNEWAVGLPAATLLFGWTDATGAVSYPVSAGAVVPTAYGLPFVFQGAAFDASISLAVATNVEMRAFDV